MMTKCEPHTTLATSLCILLPLEETGNRDVQVCWPKKSLDGIELSSQNEKKSKRNITHSIAANALLGENFSRT